MHLRPFVGLIGPSGSGKTTLITEALKQLPNQIRMMKSVTTRPRRGPEDDLSYEFVTREDMLARRDAGHLVNFSEYAGNFYGFDRRVLDETLAHHAGLQAIVESAVEPIRAGGYTLCIVRIIPEGIINQRSSDRAHADQARAKEHIEADLILHNRFEPGGLAMSTQTFIAFLRGLTNSI